MRDMVEIELAGRKFQAGMLTVEEDGNIERIARTMQLPENHRPGAPEAMRHLMRGVSEILAAAIARAGGTVAVDELLELANASGSGDFATVEAAKAFVRGAHEMAQAVIILRAARKWDRALRAAATLDEAPAN